MTEQQDQTKTDRKIDKAWVKEAIAALQAQGVENPGRERIRAWFGEQRGQAGTKYGSPNDVADILRQIRDDHAKEEEAARAKQEKPADEAPRPRSMVRLQDFPEVTGSLDGVQNAFAAALKAQHDFYMQQKTDSDHAREEAHAAALAHKDLECAKKIEDATKPLLSDITRLKSENETLEADYKEASEERDEWKRKVEEEWPAEEARIHQEAQEAAEAFIAQQLAPLNQTIIAAKDALGQVTADKTALEAELKQVRKQADRADKLQERIDVLNERIGALSQVERELAEERKKADAQTAQITTLKDRVAVLEQTEKALADERLRITSLEEQIAALTTRAQEAEAEADALRQQTPIKEAGDATVPTSA